MLLTTRFTLIMPLLTNAQASLRLRGAVSALNGVANEYMINQEVVVATPEATGKVNLIILSEGGCPPCEARITGELNDMITSPGFADILNVRHIR